MVRPPDPERVLRRLGRQRLGDPAQRIGEQRAVGCQRPAAEAVAVEPDRRQLRGALAPQRLDAAALDDREDPRRLAAALRGRPIEFVAAAPRPADGALDRSLLLGLGVVGAVSRPGTRPRRAQLELERDHPLGRQVPLLARRRLAEDHLVVADHAAARVLADQAPDLEAARVADDRTVPVHEPMDAAGRLHHPRAWAAAAGGRR